MIFKATGRLEKYASTTLNFGLHGITDWFYG